MLVLQIQRRCIVVCCCCCHCHCCCCYYCHEYHYFHQSNCSSSVSSSASSSPSSVLVALWSIYRADHESRVCPHSWIFLHQLMQRYSSTFVLVQLIYQVCMRVHAVYPDSLVNHKHPCSYNIIIYIFMKNENNDYFSDRQQNSSM